MSNDIELAKRVLEEYAEHSYPFLEKPKFVAFDYSLGLEGCIENLDLPTATCEALVTSLGRGSKGWITTEDREILTKANFSQKFIDEIAGGDGGKALRERIKWLGDHIGTSWYWFDYDEETRVDMISEIGRTGQLGNKIYQKILEAAKDDPSLRNNAIDALVEIGAPPRDVIPFLMECLGNEHYYVVQNAIRTIGSYGAEAKPAIPALANLFNVISEGCKSEKVICSGLTDHGRTSLYQNIAVALIRIGGEGGIKTLTDVYNKSTDDEVRLASAWALANLEPGAESAMLLFCQLAVKDNYGLLNKLIYVPDPNVAPVLISIAKREGYGTDARLVAIHALANISNYDERVKTLIELSRDADPKIRRAAVASLDRPTIRTWDVLSAAAERLEDEDSFIRNKAIELIGDFGPAAWTLTEGLTKFLDGEHSQTTIESLGKIGIIGAPWSNPALVKLLFHKDERIAQSAFWALRNIGPTESLMCQAQKAGAQVVVGGLGGIGVCAGQDCF